MSGSSEKSTPMMRQYLSIRAELPDQTLLMFRLGDFYEMFFEDASEGASILNISLTKRGTTPMCGIPYHAASTYISKILEAGKKVALCEQVEEATPGKLVKRAVTQILTPGSHFDDKLLRPDANNYLVSLMRSNQLYGLAMVDLTTGDFRVASLSDQQALVSELSRIGPSEVVIPCEDKHLSAIAEHQRLIVSPHDDWTFQEEPATRALMDHFKVASLDGFGLKNAPSGVGAAGGLLHYITQQLRRDVSHITRLTHFQPNDYLMLDATTLNHLEIFPVSGRVAHKSPSLYDAIHQTVTPMGSRRLKEWLARPLIKPASIRERQKAIEICRNQPAWMEAFRGELKQIRDLERTISRLSVGSGNARDLISLKLGLQKIPTIRAMIQQACDASRATRHREDFASEVESLPFGSLITLAEKLVECPEVVELIEKAILEEPAATLKEGHLIKTGYHEGLDELQSAKRDGQAWIAAFQSDEIQNTNIPSLKIKFNAVFGYFIEVTKTHLDKVPSHYQRKQTIANGERYITNELKEMEGKMLGAEEKASKLEYELFLRVREQTLDHLKTIQSIAMALAELDVISSLAYLALMRDYCRPEMTEDGACYIDQGRHPVLEESITGDRFVPNDTSLDLEKEQIAILTGPNMAGKSTYIRQTALLVLLAHTGAFIPARSARIGIVDRIFTRIGASDDLARGQSTFMVEMSETANILHHATRSSLVILDEIGRGTSTFDGLSLAWSIVEYLHHHLGAKTLFATHYHELTELADKTQRIRNYHVAVKEWNDKIVFLHQILPGNTDKSYGIQVARLAGVPLNVIERAKQILSNLEEVDLTPEGSQLVQNRHRAERQKLRALEPSPQMDLFAGMS